MGEREPLTRTMKVSEARQQLGPLLNEVFRKEVRVVVEKSGIPVAAIISTDDLNRLQEFEERRAERFKILDEIGDAFANVPPEELELEVARAIAAARRKPPVEG